MDRFHDTKTFFRLCTFINLKIMKHFQQLLTSKNIVSCGVHLHPLPLENSPPPSRIWNRLLFRNYKRGHTSSEEDIIWTLPFIWRQTFKAETFHNHLKLFLSSQIKSIAKFSKKSKKQVFWIFILCCLKAVSKIFSLVIVVLRGKFVSL